LTAIPMQQAHSQSKMQKDDSPTYKRENMFGDPKIPVNTT